jgi:hypothetical protein
MNSFPGWLLIVLILIAGCKSVKVPAADSPEVAANKSINIFVLGSVIVEYHKKNNRWPENRSLLEASYDSAKLLLVNFDTLHFQHGSNYLTVNYRFIKHPSAPATISFLEQDKVRSEKSHLEWCHDKYEKTILNFEGQMIFKYDNGYYTCL